jgi:type IV pilus assembly protein PilC
MPSFRYSARTLDGRPMSGTVEAVSQDEAVAQLRQRSMVILSISESARRRRTSLFASRQPRPRVSTDDLVVFTRQLSTMISAGIPLVEALEIMEQQVEDRGFKIALARIVESVRSGSDFSQALSLYPRVFGNIYINMVKAGEVSGQLDIILVRLAEYQEAAAALKREIVAAMTYPVVALVMVFGITVFLMVGIVPKFKEIFDSLEGIKLPGITLALLAVSNFMRTKALYWVGCLVALFVGVILYKRTDRGGYQFDWLVLRVPILGPLFQKVALSRFSRTFSTLIRSGVPILGALEIVAGTAGNRVVAEAIDRAREAVRQGEPLAEPLSQSDVFPPMVTRMISVGERSGSLEELLGKISDFYDQQVTAAVQSLTSVIEPVLIGIMGVLVGSIVLAVFMPILKLTAHMSET